MTANFWITIGGVCAVVAALAIPYGFYLKTKGDTSPQKEFESSDSVAGDKVQGDKFVFMDNSNQVKEPQKKFDSKVSIARVKINREFEDYTHKSSDIFSSFQKGSDLLASKCNAQGTLTSGGFIQLQMDLAQETKNKIERTWTEMQRKIQDILMSDFGKTVLSDMATEFTEENKKMTDVADSKGQLYKVIEGFPKSWEQRVFSTQNLTKNFKLR